MNPFTKCQVAYNILEQKMEILCPESCPHIGCVYREKQHKLINAETARKLKLELGLYSDAVICDSRYISAFPVPPIIKPISLEELFA